MKVKILNKDLLTANGFTRTSENICAFDDMDALEKEEYEYADYVREIEYTRRGQAYYLLSYENSDALSLWASKPDGDGGAIDVSNFLTVLFELKKNGVIDF